MMTTEILSVGGSQFLKSAKSFPNIILAPLELHEDLGSKRNRLSQAITVLELPEGTLTASHLKSIIDEMTQRDDVFNQAFLSTIMVRRSSFLDSKRFPSTKDLTEIFEALDLPINRFCYFESSSKIPRGPYFYHEEEHELYPALKLYPDPYGAFVYGVLQSKDDCSSYEKSLTQHIPVPSRLFFPDPTPSKPLSGKRFAVKDIFDVKGVKTTASCKAYEECYAKAEITASIIQKLIDLGAAMVGKTKTAPLASGLAAKDWIDSQCPFNPRGDGYQDPDCSSSGSAVAVAAYDWLDFSVGSDTLGSMVGPAAANGIYGIRPTHGLQDRDGTLLVSTLFDTAGLFSRDANEFLNLTNLWYGQTLKEKFPTKILFPKERFDPYTPTTLSTMMEFISDLEQTTNIQKTTLDINSLWSKNTPSGITGSLEEYLQTTLAHIQLYDCYHNNEKFRNNYKAKFAHEPYVEPMIQYKWNLGAKLTAQDYSKARNERETFRKFLLTHVLTPGTVMLLPGGYPDVNYRDDYPSSFEEHGYKFQGFGFKDTAFSALGGLPCISFPVGQILYDSKITKRQEYRPVSLMLLGAPGMDGLLIDLVKRVLEKSKRPLSVKVGKTAF